MRKSKHQNGFTKNISQHHITYLYISYPLKGELGSNTEIKDVNTWKLEIHKITL